jgi:hypothetical protein
LSIKNLCTAENAKDRRENPSSEKYKKKYSAISAFPAAKNVAE